MASQSAIACGRIRLLNSSASVSPRVTVTVVSSFVDIFYINANCCYSDCSNALGVSRDSG